jgi:hypothetical protein
MPTYFDLWEEDDILIKSESAEEHLKRARVMDTLCTTCNIKTKKYTFNYNGTHAINGVYCYLCNYTFWKNIHISY